MTYPFRQSYYHDYGDRKGTLGLDFHMSEGGDGLLDYLGDGGTPPLRGVSANYANLSDGTIWRMLGWNETAGTLNPADRATDTTYYGPRFLKAVLGDHWPDPNVWSISMEIAGYRDKGPTRPQVESAVAWAADMKARFPTLRGAFGHHDQSPKGCPGTTPNMLEIFQRIGGHGLWTPTAEDPVGVNIVLQATTGSDPLASFLTAKIRGAGHVIHRVGDYAEVAVADGLNLGLTQQATVDIAGRTWFGTDNRVLVFNYGDHGLFMARLGDCDTAALPAPVDATPYSQADLDADALIVKAAARGTALEQARAAAIKGAGDAIDALPR